MSKVIYFLCANVMLLKSPLVSMQLPTSQDFQIYITNPGPAPKKEIVSEIYLLTKLTLPSFTLMFLKC